MGRGIAGAIPIKFRIESYHEREYLNPKQLGFYQQVASENSLHSYVIKEPDFIRLFHPFYDEFNRIVYENEKVFSNDAMQRYDAEVTDMDSFLALLEEYKDTGKIPFYGEYSIMLSILGMDVTEYVIFYAGSYKAFLETYETFTHMERMLCKAMENPLAHVVKFGLFG